MDVVEVDFPVLLRTVDQLYGEHVLLLPLKVCSFKDCMMIVLESSSAGVHNQTSGFLDSLSRILCIFLVLKTGLLDLPLSFVFCFSFY